VPGEPVGLAVDGSDLAVVAFRRVQLVDPTSGRPRWTTELSEPSEDDPAMSGDRVAFTTEHWVTLLDRATGNPIAAASFRGPGPVGFARAGDGTALAVAGSTQSGEVIGVDAPTGLTKWTVRFPGEVWTAPQGAADVVVLHSEEEVGSVIRGLDSATGAVRWEVRTGPVSSAPLVTGDLVVLADSTTPSDARVRALDVRTGRERWSTPAPGSYGPGIQPGSDGQAIYLLDAAGTLAAFDLASGAPRWRTEARVDVVEGRPTIIDGIVVLSTFGRRLVFVDAASGKIRHVATPPGVVNDVEGLGERVFFSVRLGRPSGVESGILRRVLP
jgi:outer membrane protein assembly factor BamB